MKMLRAESRSAQSLRSPKQDFGGTSQFRNLSIGLVLALAFTAIGVMPSQASATCSGGGSVTVVGTVVTGHTGCSGVVSLPNNITEIGAYAFNGATLITSIAIPDSVHSIKYAAFYGTSSLSAVTFGAQSRLVAIGSLAFGASGIENIVIPDSVESIGPGAFQFATSLSAATFGPDSQLGTLGLNAFFGATALRTISIPDGVEELPYGVFARTSSLSSIVFGPNSRLRTIEMFAFEVATALPRIDVPQSVTRIGEQAFAFASSLSAVTFLGPAPTVGNNVFALVAAGAQARVSRTHLATFGVEGSVWNDLTLSVPSSTLTLDSDQRQLTQSLDFGLSPTPPNAEREGFNLSGWAQTQGGEASFNADLSDFVMGPNPTTLFAVWEQIVLPPNEEAKEPETLQFQGPLIHSVDKRNFKMNAPSTITFTGRRLHQAVSASVNGTELVLIAVTRQSISFELPAMQPGSYSVVIRSSAGSLTLFNLLKVD